MKLPNLLARYGLEDGNEKSVGLGMNLVAALKQSADAPEVARAGLKLLPATAIASDEIHCSSRQVSKDNISLASTALGPQIRSFSAPSGDEMCPGSVSSDGKRVLQASADGPGHNSTFSVEHRGDARVSELRKLLACSMRLAVVKVQVMAEADGVAWALGDNDRADLADILFIRKSSAACKAVPPVLSLEQTLALQKDFLDGLTESGIQPISTLLQKEILESVLFKHGLKPSPIVSAAVLRAVDTHATNSESRRLGEEVNEVLGLQPQVYQLQAIQSRVSMAGG